MGKSLETTRVRSGRCSCALTLCWSSRSKRALRPLRLPPLTWYDVLWGLEQAPEQRLRMSELADKVVLSRSNLTRLVDRLEEAGLVARERSAEDRRGAYAVLTEPGRDLRTRMWPPYQAAIRELFESRLSETEADLMATILRRLLDAAHDVAPERPVRGRGEQSPVRSHATFTSRLPS